jgi:hypothetical protein
METLKLELTAEERKEKVIALMKRLVADKRQTQKEMREGFKTNPEIQKVIKELEIRNNERGTPIVRL